MIELFQQSYLSLGGDSKSCLCSECQRCVGPANPENFRQIFQVKLLLQAEGKWGNEYEISEELLSAAEKVLHTTILPSLTLQSATPL